MAQSLQSVKEDVLRDRILDAVNVSAVLDNCFFHSLALYYLTSEQLNLPVDLFAKFDGREPEQLTALKTKFPNKDSLAFFDYYASVADPENNPLAGHLVEKTMILGIFLRSWFIKRLSEHQLNREKRFNSAGQEAQRGVDEKDITFMSLVNAYHAARLQDALNDNPDMEKAELSSFKEQVAQDPIYQANSDYFLKLADEIDEDLCKVYWDSEGYARYCAYLNTNVKMSYSDVAAILQDEQIPYVIYSHHDTSLINSHLPVDSALPLFELALDAGEGHYFLLKTEQTRASLEAYDMQHEFYKQERITLLTLESVVYLEKAKGSHAQFLAATLPFDFTDLSPLDLIVTRLGEMQDVIDNPRVVVTPQTNASKESVPTKSPRRGSPRALESAGDNNAKQEGSLPPREKSRSPRQKDPSPRTNKNAAGITATGALDPVKEKKQPPRQRKRAALNAKPVLRSKIKTEDQKEWEEQIARLENSLDLLLAKKSGYERRLEANEDGLSGEEFLKFEKKYNDAIEAVSILHGKISGALKIYKANPTVDRYFKFRNQSLQLISQYKPVLAEKRDDHVYYANVVGFIVGLGVFYGICALINYFLNNNRCTFFMTDGEQRVYEVEDNINIINPAPAA